MLRRLSFLPYLRTCPHSGETLPAFAQKAMSKDAQGSWVNLPNASGTSGHYLIVTVPDFSRHFLLYKLER